MYFFVLRCVSHIVFYSEKYAFDDVTKIKMAMIIHL